VSDVELLASCEDGSGGGGGGGGGGDGGEEEGRAGEYVEKS